MTTRRISWPDGKRFAFTIFDDPDAQTLAQSQAVYGFLGDQGFRTTMGVWTVEPGEARRNSGGETCANPAYRSFAQELQSRGFEIGFHSAAPATLSRAEIASALETFQEYFGAYPETMANHYNGDAMYWGPARLSGAQQALYKMVTRGRERNRFFGEVPSHESFWGDLCRRHIRYCRNFVLRELNTLKFCPWMPYHDADRPFVNFWYASSEAANYPSFVRLMTSEAIDRLEEEGGAAILYTHFGHGYADGGKLDSRFKEVMQNVSKRNGWAVPVSVLLRYLESQGNGQTISYSARSKMERRWLRSKMFHGTS